MKDSSIEFAHTALAQEATFREARRLVDDEGVSWNDAMRAAATTLDGAADHPGKTVESVQTCTDLERNPIMGVSGDDIPEARNDPFGSSERKRHEEAELGLDEAAGWLKKHDPKNTKK